MQTLAERKLLHLRHADSCATCGLALAAGTLAYWLKQERVVLCVDCGVEPACEPAALAPSSPGASAGATYERGRQGREDRQRERYGRIGGWAARMSAGPQHERAWAKGAAGELENAQRLQKRLAGKPVILLHDRGLPGRRSNIDHIAVGPGGVTVVDSKKMSGKVRVDWHGGLFSEREFDLYVNRRRRTNLVESVERQVQLVEVVLADEGRADVPVAGALCMAEVQGLPVFRRLRIREIAIDGTRRIADLIARAGDLDAAAVHEVASILDRRFPPA